MRTAAFLAVLALAGGGCIESKPDIGSASIYWTFHSHLLGDIGTVTDTATSVCAAAGVQDVQIALIDPDGMAHTPVTVSCITPNDVPGIAFRSLGVGTWKYDLVGRRAHVAAYEASGTFEVVKGMWGNVDVRADPLAGRWDVAVTFTAAACNAGDRLAFDLLSTAGGGSVAFTTRDDTVNPRITVPCALSGSFTIPSVEAGPYAFSAWERVDSGGATVAWSTCRPTWDQLSTADKALTVDLSAGAAPAAGSAGNCAQ
jgi:hypothetical protein